jgi:hypothetical protein
VLNLAAAEWNDGELVDAILHYPPGSEKQKAVCFLIAQMDDHLYVHYVNPDDPLNPFSPDEGVDWLREYVWDYSTMTSELLIEDVEYAFLARESFPWCRNLPENIFFDYVLPYRSTQEPVGSWRPVMFEELAPMVAGLGSCLEVSDVINQYNGQRFRFDELYYRHPEDRDMFTCIASGAGRCEDISNLANYCLRAVGVPMASDFTPWWPKGDNNHAWNTVYDNGKWYISADNPLPNPNQSTIYAKVYRESFSAGPIMGPAPDGTLPPRLMRTSAIDVTADYTTVCDVNMRVDNPARATYLCVFNFGDWRAVGGAWAEDDSVLFKDVGNKDILYCATRYVEDETGWGKHYPVAPPFVLHPNGTTEQINPCPMGEATGDIVLIGWRTGAPLETGAEVKLFMYAGVEASWEGEAPAEPPISWVEVGSVVVEDINGAPTALFPGTAVDGGLYALTDLENIEEFREGSRPFIWKNSEVTYY